MGYNILEDYGTNYIVVEDKDHDNLPEMKLLRRILNSGNFTLRTKIDLTTNLSWYRGANILIYEYSKNVSLRKKTLEIEIPKMGRKISIPIKNPSDSGSNSR